MDTDVLIAGGSLSGLSAAIFLAQHGVRSVVVERHPGTAIHPRINGITHRSMELFDSIGLGDRIRAVGRTGDELGTFHQTETLAAEFSETYGGPEDPVPAHLSPTGMCACDQDLLEPILVDHLAGQGVVVRFGTELGAFQQSAEAVTATLRDRATGSEETVTARYLIAADGSRSGIRQRLGIGMRGPGRLGAGMSIVFRADLEPALRGRTIYAVFGPFGTLIRRRKGELWQLGHDLGPDARRPAPFTEERCVELIRAATGLADLVPELVTVLPLEDYCEVAERFDDGRIFLIGDAAHPAPAEGGLGGNMCIHDAHNLAWKMAAVITGTADPRLLGTYDIERRPIAVATIATQTASLAPDHEDAHDWDYAELVLGHRYRSPAILSSSVESDSPRSCDPLVDPRSPHGEPGIRAPHVVIEHAGRPRSTIDLTCHGFVVLAGSNGQHWCDAAHRVGSKRNIAINAYRAGTDLLDIENQLPTTYALTPDSVVLVRPDGFIGWRHDTDQAGHDADCGLEDAISRILCPRSP